MIPETRFRRPRARATTAAALCATSSALFQPAAAASLRSTFRSKRATAQTQSHLQAQVRQARVNMAKAKMKSWYTDITGVATDCDLVTNNGGRHPKIDCKFESFPEQQDSHVTISLLGTGETGDSTGPKFGFSQIVQSQYSANGQMETVLSGASAVPKAMAYDPGASAMVGSDGALDHDVSNLGRCMDPRRALSSNGGSWDFGAAQLWGDATNRGSGRGIASGSGAADGLCEELGKKMANGQGYSISAWWGSGQWTAATENGGSSYVCPLVCPASERVLRPAGLFVVAPDSQGTGDVILYLPVQGVIQVPDSNGVTEQQSLSSAFVSLFPGGTTPRQASDQHYRKKIKIGAVKRVVCNSGAG